MKFLIVLSLLISACTSHKATVNTKTTLNTNNISGLKYTISGKLMQKSSYCGGARPTQAILDGYKDPKQLKAYTVYVKQGSINNASAAIIDSTTTNDLGEYSFSLPSGDYVLVSSSQLNDASLSSIVNQKDIKVSDQTCLDEWFKNGLIQFTVKDQAITNLDHLSRKSCDIPDGIPCLRFTGRKRP